MKRRKFLNLLGLETAVTIISPIVLLDKEKPKYYNRGLYQFPYKSGFKWINKQEHDFLESFKIDRDRSFIIICGSDYLREYNKILQDYVKYYYK